MKTKTILIILTALLFPVLLFSQEEENGEKKQFKENLFTGGSLTVSFFRGGSILGINPMFGYRINKWIDGGIVFNYTYAGQRDVIYINDKIRQHVYGPGLFMRVYPLPMIFILGQFEHNFTNVTYTYPSGFKEKNNYGANSFLTGLGLAQGRDQASNTFYYICLLVDVIKDKNSPYVENVYDNVTGQLVRTDLIPIVRAGINIGLFEKRNNNERGDGRKKPRNY